MCVLSMKNNKQREKSNFVILGTYDPLTHRTLAHQTYISMIMPTGPCRSRVFANYNKEIPRSKKRVNMNK